MARGIAACVEPRSFALAQGRPPIGPLHQHRQGFPSGVTVLPSLHTKGIKPPGTVAAWESLPCAAAVGIARETPHLEARGVGRCDSA